MPHAAIDSEIVPPQKKKKLNPPLSFLSLPNVIIQHCLVWISKSYYAKLSLVSKTFRDLGLSSDLKDARIHHETREVFFLFCLQFPNCPLPSWFTLWIKPDQIMTNEIKKKKKSTGNTLLVPVPSSYNPRMPHLTVTVGLEYYAFRQGNGPCPLMLVINKGYSSGRLAPNMTVARLNALATVLDGKIYVMGGCGANESTNWAEVFDTKTQTWESLPDPGAELCNSSIRKIEVQQGKLKVRTNGIKDYAYDPKEGKWNVIQKSPVQCKVGDIWYQCDGQLLRWYDSKRKEWRVVRGLAMLSRNLRGGMIEIVEYHGKLLILWDKFVYPGPRDYNNIWCAVIALEKCNSYAEEVWGKIKWANIVLTVSSSYLFLRSIYSRG